VKDDKFVIFWVNYPFKSSSTHSLSLCRKPNR